MDPEYWKRLKAAFHCVYDARGPARTELLLELSASDPELYASVLELLAEDEHASRRDWWPVGRTAEAGVSLRGNERFDLLERIGSGGFGVVYRARDNTDERIVALKILHARAPESMLSFKQEFRSVADRRHPNLVAVHELFIEPYAIFFTMDLVEGVPITEHLRVRLEQTNHVGDFLNVCVNVFAQLACGLIALHRAGILHRDLKPSNVLVTEDGHVVLLDFGLASTIGRDLNRQWGTPEYMAPELLAAAPATPQSDWYAFGVLMYECLTGVHPNPRRRSASRSVTLAPVSCNFETQPLARNSASERRPSTLVQFIPQELDDLCSQLLEPDPERRADVDSIMAILGIATEDCTSGPTSARCDARFPLVGREHQLMQLERCFERARAGRLVVARICGRSGFGKSALVHRFLSRVSAQVPQTVVLSGRCHERENLGFRVFDGIIDDLVRLFCSLPVSATSAFLPPDAAELAILFPAFAAVTERLQLPVPSDWASPTEHRLRAFSALREILRRIGESRPLVLFVDDLQWGDADSEPLLRHLLRRDDLRALLVVAYRQEDLGSRRLDNLVQACELPRDNTLVSVDALSRTEVRYLLESNLGTTHPMVSAVLESQEGTPWLIGWLLDELRTATRPASIPPHSFGFEALLDRAIGDLPAPARHLLGLVAIGARPMPRPLLYAALQGPRDLGRDAEDVLRTKRMLRLGADGTLETSHDRIRQAVVERLKTQERRGLHAALLAAMPANSDPETLAVHAIGANHVESARVHCIAAGRNCASELAFDRAATHFRWALQSRIEPKSYEADIRVQLADVLVHSGRCREAAEQYLIAAETIVERRFELRLIAGQQLMRSGEITSGRQLLNDLLSQSRVRFPSSRYWLALRTLVLRAELMVTPIPTSVTKRDVPLQSRLLLDTLWALSSSLALVDTLGSVYFQSLHLSMALRESDLLGMARALSLEAVLSSVEGRWSKRRSIKLLERLQRMLRTEDAPTANGLLQLARGIVAWMQGDFLRCLAMTEDCEALLRRETGQSFEVATSRAFALASLIWLGRLREHAVRFESLFEDACLRSDLHAQSSLVLLAHAHIAWLAQDDAALARNVVVRTLDAWPVQSEFSLQHIWAWFALIETDLYEAKIDAAASRMDRDWSKVRSTAHLRIAPIRIWMRQLRARVALAELALVRTCGGATLEATDRETRLLRRVQQLVRALEREPLPLGQALAALTAGLLERARGARDSAARQFQMAIMKFSELDMQLHLSAARWGAAGLESEPTSEQRTRDALVSELQAIGVRAPERFMAMLVPGA